MQMQTPFSPDQLARAKNDVYISMASTHGMTVVEAQHLFDNFDTNMKRASDKHQRAIMELTSQLNSALATHAAKLGKVKP